MSAKELKSRPFSPAPRHKPSGVYPCEPAPLPVPMITGNYDAPAIPKTPMASPAYGQLVEGAPELTEPIDLTALAAGTVGPGFVGATTLRDGDLPAQSREPTDEELDAAFGPAVARPLFEAADPGFQPGPESGSPSEPPSGGFAGPSEDTGPVTTFGYQMRDPASEEVDEIEIEIEIEVETPVRLEAALAWQSQSQLWADRDGTIGIFLASYTVLPVGAEIELHVHLPGEQPFTAPARVCWLREGSEGSWPGLGLELEWLTLEAHDAIARFAQMRRPLDMP